MRKLTKKHKKFFEEQWKKGEFYLWNLVDKDRTGRIREWIQEKMIVPIDQHTYRINRDIVDRVIHKQDHPEPKQQTLG